MELCRPRRSAREKDNEKEQNNDAMVVLSRQDTSTSLCGDRSGAVTAIVDGSLLTLGGNASRRTTLLLRKFTLPIPQNVQSNSFRCNCLSLAGLEAASRRAEDKRERYRTRRKKSDYLIFRWRKRADGQRSTSRHID